MRFWLALGQCPRSAWIASYTRQEAILVNGINIEMSVTEVVGS